MSGSLRFLAGTSAFARIRSQGFDVAQIDAVVGASGGPKWFVLSQIDRVIARDILPRVQGPVHLVGSSIGAWRMACYACASPANAIGRLEEAYVGQVYDADANSADIAGVARDWIDDMLGSQGAEEVLNSPTFRLHVIAARAKRFSAREERLPLTLGLAAAASSNAVNRRWLGRHFERTLFSDPRTPAPFAGVADGIPTVTSALTPKNLAPAILASSAIPLLMPGVSNIAGAQPGVYRDGGIVDYHIDLPISGEEGISLYPHFVDQLIPGWFDKRIRWRRASAANTHNMLVICPSADFVARLPGGKIPDRSDFKRYTAAERVNNWRQAISQCRELADELVDVLAKDQLPRRLEPLG